MIKYISGDILQSKDEYIAQGVAIGSLVPTIRIINHEQRDKC